MVTFSNSHYSSSIKIIFFLFVIEQRSRLQGIEDVDRSRLAQLRQYHPDVYEGITWLRANRDKFKANIYEPPAISVSFCRKI